MRKRIIIIVVSAVVFIAILATLIICLSTCQSASENGRKRDEKTEEKSDWNRATMKWVSGTLLNVELRVKSGFEYEMEPFEDNHGCKFRTSDGKEVSILVQGLDYEKSFDSLVAYFRSLNPEKLLVGKVSKTIISVYNSEETEICSKLSDMECLTIKTSDVETADDFFSTVMIRVERKDYSPLDLSEEFDEIK